MQRQFYKTADGQSGLFFTAFGLFIAVYSLQYTLGKPSQMGPGFFPLVLGIVLTLVGLLVVVQSLRAEKDFTAPFEWRSAIIITGAILASGLLLLTAGLLVAIPVLVIVASLAAQNLRWQSILGAAVVLTALAYGIFILGLGMRIPLIWS